MAKRHFGSMKYLVTVPNIAVIASGLTALVLFGPAINYILDPLLRWLHLTDTLGVLFSPLSLIIFLLYGVGKIVCAALALSCVILWFSPAADLRTKSLTTGVAAFAVLVDIQWILATQHLW
jgi:hypothetical protein